MAHTVAVSFDTFLENISVTGDHKATATARKDRLVSILSSTFTILDAFSTGSIPRGTGLKGSADLDVIVVLHWEKHVKNKTPTQLLQDVRDALGEYRTNVRKNGQAVTLYYDSWPDVEIVPVSRVMNDDGTVNYYSVPNITSGRWIRSRPRRHANAIDEKANDCGPRFKPLIRMIKEWNAAHSDLMTSYHIEVLCMKIFSSSMDDYPWSIFQFFDEAADLVAKPLEDEGGFADDYLDTQAARDEVVARLAAARDRARNAWYCTYGGRSDHQEAIRLWRVLFGDRFPAYG